MKSYLRINDKCISCHNCKVFCPENSIMYYDNEYAIDEWTCNLCWICVLICPVEAIETIEEKIEETQE